MVALVVAALSALCISFLCSLAEASLLSVRPAQVQALGESRAGRLLGKFKREIDEPISAILILNTTAHTIGAAVAGASYVAVFGESSLWVFSLVFTVLVLIFSEIVPKTLGVAKTGSVIVPVVYGVQAAVGFFRPLIWLMRLIPGVRRDEDAPVTSLEEIRLLAALGRTEGAVAKRTADMIEGAARLRELTAYDVMVPRTVVTFLSAESSLEENLRVVRTSGYSRFPYSKEGSIDRVEGIVLARDLIFSAYDARGQSLRTPTPVESLVRTVPFVPAAMPLEELLKLFQEQRSHMVIVVDEFGGTEGIVTLEDVLEEIVGEIEDESDRVHPFIVRRADGSLSCRALAEMRKVFEVLDIDVDAESVSLGGFMAEKLGRIPEVGDEVCVAGYCFRVLHSSARRAEQVSIEPVEEPEDARGATDPYAVHPSRAPDSGRKSQRE